MAWKSSFRQNYRTTFSPTVPTSAAGVSHVMADVQAPGGEKWEHLKSGGMQWQTTPKNLPRMQRTRAIPVAWLNSSLCPDRPKGWIPIIINNKLPCVQQMELRSGSLYIYILSLITDSIWDEHQGFSTSQIKQYKEFSEAFITEAVWTLAYFRRNCDIKRVSCSLLYRLIRRFVKLIVMEYFCRVFQRRDEGQKKRGSIKYFVCHFSSWWGYHREQTFLRRGQEADGHKSPITYIDDNKNWIFLQFRSTGCLSSKLGYGNDNHGGLYLL